MSRKAVIKRIVSKWGMMSVDLQYQQIADALKSDQAVFEDEDRPLYLDNPKGDEEE